MELEITAELTDIAKHDCLKTEAPGSIDIHLLVIEEERLFGAGSHPFAGEAVDGGIGLGHAQLTGEGEMAEAGQPGKLPAHVAGDLMRHVGEDGGGEAGTLERGGPGEHGLDQASGPHADVIFHESLELGGSEGSAHGIAETPPELRAVEAAEVVFVAVVPIMLLESLVIDAGDLQERLVGSGIGATEDIAVVEEDSAHTSRLQGSGCTLQRPGSERCMQR